jgi:hypothetical protein
VKAGDLFLSAYMIFSERLLIPIPNVDPVNEVDSNSCTDCGDIEAHKKPGKERSLCLKVNNRKDVDK